MLMNGQRAKGEWKGEGAYPRLRVGSQDSAQVARDQKAHPQTETESELACPGMSGHASSDSVSVCGWAF